MAPGMLRVARRQVHVRLLRASAERGARHGEALHRARAVDKGRLPRRRETAVREEVVEIATRAEEPHTEERAECSGQRRRLEAEGPRPRHDLYVPWLR